MIKKTKQEKDNLKEKTKKSEISKESKEIYLQDLRKVKTNEYGARIK